MVQESIQGANKWITMHEGSAEAVALSLRHEGLGVKVRGTQPHA